MFSFEIVSVMQNQMLEQMKMKGLLNRYILPMTDVELQMVSVGASILAVAGGWKQNTGCTESYGDWNPWEN